MTERGGEPGRRTAEAAEGLRGAAWLVPGSALWFGLVGGIAEAAFQFLRSSVLHYPNDHPYWAEVVWMAPLAAVALLGAVALVVLPVDALVGRYTPLVRRAAPGLFAGLVAYGLVRTLSLGVQPAAVAVLAAGVGARVGLATFRRFGAWRRWVLRTTPWLLGAVTLWGLCVPILRRVPERGGLAEGEAVDRPNVLLILWDTVRAANVSVYGYGRPTTPNLERLGSEGAVFERAIATAPWTLPSHVSLFTGRWRHEFSAGWREPMDDSLPTLAGRFTELGYVTAGFSANRHYVSPAFGVDRGFAHFDARGDVSVEMIAHSWWLTRELATRARERWGATRQLPYRRRAEDVNRALLDWLDARPRPERPFFAFVNVFDAHEPYLPPEPYNLRFNDRQPLYFVPFHGSLPPRLLAQVRDAYDSSIFYLDVALGRLLDRLRERGLLDDTIVIVTSDHGEEFGEHGPGLLTHGRTLYMPALHVPLVIWYPPRVRAGVRTNAVVSIRDIPATVMDLIDAPHPFPGRSLGPLLAGLAAPDPGALSAEPVLSQVNRRWDADRWPDWPASQGTMYSVVEEGHHLIRGGTGRLELYDIIADPWETRDLAPTTRANVLSGYLETLTSFVGPFSSSTSSAAGGRMGAPGGVVSHQGPARPRDGPAGPPRTLSSAAGDPGR